MKPVLLDTGAIVAALDRSEGYHRRVLEALDAVDRPLVTCEPVITEACYLLRKLPGASEAVLDNVASGAFQIPFQLSACSADIRRILRRYRDRRIDLADACLIHLAGLLATGDVLTLDTDFEVYRWGRNKPFNLLIPLR